MPMIWLALLIGAAQAQTGEELKTGGLAAWTAGIPKLVPARPKPPPPAAAPAPARLALAEAMRYAVEFSEAHDDPDSEHTGLPKEDRDRVRAWVQEIEKSRDELAWLARMAETPSAEDRAIIARVNAKMPWVTERDVFFLGGIGWQIISYGNYSTLGITLGLNGPRGPVPVAVIAAGLEPTARQFVLIHEGFHLRQKPLEDVQNALEKALKTASGSPLQPREAKDFVEFLVEGVAQRKALALARDMGMDVRPFSAKYADNASVAEVLALRLPDKSLEALIEKAEAASLVDSLGAATAVRLIQDTSSYVQRRTPSVEDLRALLNR